MEDLAACLLGETDANLLCVEPAESRAVVLAMAAQAERGLEIFSHDLDPLVYNAPEVYDTFEDMLLRNRRVARIRIVVREPHVLVQRGHYLINLAQRLPTFIEFRQPAEEHLSLRESFFLADTIGVLHRPYFDSHKANANFCDPAEAKRLSNLFQQIWEFGTPAPNLRPIYL